ncbi:hypothetical protein Y032_0010g922 [Ancylostoma ceylanicum]|uniref:Uncharacterized protein n=1 Tax=Ancylostoma ceylanicum TaxID=53326 RepID=A0A016VGF6_9BILA|nr:hypothetical protein Y032_0010g922 [Ancylostoma ceylanicum]
MVNNDKYGFFYELADMPYDCCTYLTNTRTQSSPDGSVVRAAERVKSSFYTSAPTRGLEVVQTLFIFWSAKRFIPLGYTTDIVPSTSGNY